jgi:hypothetical protein
MRIKFAKMPFILTIALAAFIFSTSPACADAGKTHWGKISEVRVGAWNTYIYFDGCNCGYHVRLGKTLDDYNQILSAVLTAMSLNLEVRFYSEELSVNNCFVNRVYIRK